MKRSKRSEAVTHEALKRMASRPTKKKTETVGDGEEIEVDEDDAEVLSSNEIDNIYKKQVSPLVPRMAAADVPQSAA